MIYLVEDDASIRELVAYALNNSGFEAEGFAAPADFWKAMEHRRPQLVLLDIMLPGEDGLQILKKLRSAPATRRLPVIMVTAKGSEYEKVMGLELGADDYIPKPFGMMELVARVKAVLRRTGSLPQEEAVSAGPIRIFPEEHRVEVDGHEVALTLKEYELLSMLLRNRGVVLTRDRLLEEIWGYSFDGENRTVDVPIRTLRQKLGPAGDLIETVRGVGYKIGGTGA